MTMDKTQLGHVKTELAKGIATIEFFHPSHNALPTNLLTQLAGAIIGAGERDDVRLILLKSGGERTFCAGASFDELVRIRDYEAGKSFFMGFANVINAMRTCPKIIVGRVQGKAVGGGVGLASSVDYCLATKYASVKLSELAIGIGPFVVGPAVQRKIGLSATSQMTLNATEWQTAAWAKQKGMFTEVLDSTEQLDAYLAEFLPRLANSNPEALRELKRIFWQEADDWGGLLERRAEISGRLVLSEFTRAALAKYQNA